MRSIRASLSAFALAVIFAKQATAQTAAANLTAHRLVDILAGEGGNPTIQLQPNPTDKPDFQYDFNIRFSSSCTADQQGAIAVTMLHIAGLADRAEMWMTDEFHDWQDEVDYWFGADSAKNVEYIKSRPPQRSHSNHVETY